MPIYLCSLNIDDFPGVLYKQQILAFLKIVKTAERRNVGVPIVPLFFFEPLLVGPDSP